MTKLTEERIKELAEQMPEGFLWHEGCRHETGIALQEAVDFARAIEAELQPDFCDTHCTWRDHHPDCERAEPVQEPVAWRYKIIPPGWTYSDKKPDKEFAGDAWERWEVTPLYLAPPDQTAEIERLRNLSACEACAEIPSVMEYFKQCEERIATLEAEAERLGSAILKIRKELTGDIHSTNNLLDVIAAERYTKATLEAALREAKDALTKYQTRESYDDLEYAGYAGDSALITIAKALGEE